MTKQAPNLKVVEPVVERDTLEGYEPLLLATGEQLNTYWPQVAAVLQRCVDDAMDGEMTMQDIYEAVCAGRMYALIAKNDEGEVPDVALALILELQAYPQFPVLHIAALGGRELDLLQSRFWKHVCSWAFMNGVRTMQACVSPAMARILKRYGFNKTYEMVRLNLTEM